jgi:hypothetical protein
LLRKHESLLIKLTSLFWPAVQPDFKQEKADDLRQLHRGCYTCA